MNWILTALREHAELAFFLTLALGYGLGALRVAGVSLGGVLGTLIAGLVVGQAGIPVSPTMQSAFFLMFLFAIGYRTGPEFFRGLRSNALPQVGLTILLCIVGFLSTLALAKAFGLDAGTSAGLLAGAMTNSAALGTATDAAGGTGPVVRSLAAAYAVTYLVGTLLVTWLLPRLGPALMRVDLATSCRELEAELGGSPTADGTESAYRDIAVRAYRLPAALGGKTVADLEGSWPPDRRVVVARIRRGRDILPAGPDLRLAEGDLLALGGRPEALVGDANPLASAEVQDRELLDIPIVSADLVLTAKRLAGLTLEALHREVAPRHLFLLKLARGGRELPFAPHSVLERGDVLTVTGLRTEVERAGAVLGFTDMPKAEADMFAVGGMLFLGALIGLPTLRLGSVDVGLSLAVGALLGGLVLGYLRSVHPRFGRFPGPTQAVFESLGLTGFLALVGLGIGPAAAEGLRASGFALLFSSVIVALLPHAVCLLVGRYVLKMHPAILLGICAGAGTSAPALAALQEKAGSKAPALGYGMACALGNVLLALGGTLSILLLSPR